MGVPISDLYLGNKQRQEAKKQGRAEQAAQDLQRRRERIAAVREAQIQRATVIQSGENQGVSESSGVQGAVASLGSQEASNLNLISQMQTLEQSITRSREKQAKYQGYRDIINTASSTAMMFTGKP